MEFFQRLGHRIVPSDALVPQNDPTLLFTGSGMNQFKDEFYGRGDRTMKRAVTCQKCLRTGDIENVGRTPSHHTFFEMLGNFSFGDYFKVEAITWAWQFMLEEMGVPADTMVVSIHETDEEAYGVWSKVIGLTDDKIYRYGEDENYWPANVVRDGPNGPCGPCSEIFVDMGPEHSCGRPGCDPSCDCPRYVEVWNLVLQQYDRQEDASLVPLPMKNIDTGMGLERMARVMQKVPTNYDIDVFQPLLSRISEICGRPYMGSEADAPLMRRIADHARAIFFCIADGVVPSNEERGYVVRRLLRRSVRDAVQLGVEELFLTELIDPVLEAFGEPYPELGRSRQHIATVVKEEEKAFQKTVRRGSVLLADHIAALKRQKASVIRGRDVFDLYQTYGFPVEMTESILKDHDITVDMQGFLREMTAHQQLSKDSAAFQTSVFVEGPLSQLQADCGGTEFTGYQTLDSEGTVLGIIAESALAPSVEEGQEAVLVLDRSPAYAEAGGQAGDAGTMEVRGKSRGRFLFSDVKREKGFMLHAGRVESGRLKVGDRVLCTVDRARRRATARNHSATHLLHYALRHVLGESATQSGSAVSAERLRFDFSHPTGLSPDELLEVERIINEKVLEDLPILATQMGLSEARRLGATALFGEKYGDIVRVMTIGEISRELCGGTHCERTGEIGLVRIVSESSVAGGVRRIEAVTGMNSLERLRAKEGLLQSLCAALSTQEENLLGRAKELLKEIRFLSKQLQKAREEAVTQMASGSLLDRAEKIGDVRAVFQKVEGGHAELRSAADVLRKGEKALACLLAGVEGDKVALVAAATSDLVERGLSAVDLVKAASAVLGGGGGGRPDLAQAGGSGPEKIDEAFGVARKHIAEKLGR